jgi:asparagine synthase (glutamine-hydrolysing)
MRFYLNCTLVKEELYTILDQFDEPFEDSSALANNFIPYLARNDVKVIHTVDCAEELFGGYNKYLANYDSSKFRRLPKIWRILFCFMVNCVPRIDYLSKCQNTNCLF